MNRIVLYIALAIFSFNAATAQQAVNYVEKPSNASEEELNWHVKLTEAHALSQETGKPIFGFFTGSDWCGWCKKLQAAVFKKPAFKEWAKENVILLELDFPRKTKLPAEIAQQNQELQQLFQVRGYPTVWLFNTVLDPATNKFNITALGQAGYPRGGTPGKEEVVFIDNMEKILASAKAATATPPSDKE